MEWSYPTGYSDGRGVELTTLRNDGAKLSLRLRDVAFSGRDFDSLQPDPDSTLEALSNFDLLASAL